MNEETEEELLDQLPLSKDELHLLATSIPVTFRDPRLESMFQYSLETVFCTNPKHTTFEAIVSVCGRRGDRFLYDMMAHFIEGNHGVNLERLVLLLLETLAMNQNANSKWTELFQSKPAEMKRRDWLQRVVPFSSTVVANAFCHHFGLKEPSSSQALHSLTLEDAESLWSDPIVDEQLVMMGFGGSWKSLYDSNVDGLSFLPVQNSLLGFSGPTMLLVETTDGDILGYYTSVSWKEVNKWYVGEGDSCLFRLSPHWSVYRRHDSSAPFHQFLHHTGKNLAGLAVGGIAEFTPRFHLTVDLDEHCKACAVGSVFDKGELLTADTSYFTPGRIQIWALADDAFGDHYARGQQTIELRETNRQRLAKVDKREFLDHFVLDSKVFGHRNQVQGRVDHEVLAASLPGNP